MVNVCHYINDVDKCRLSNSCVPIFINFFKKVSIKISSSKRSQWRKRSHTKLIMNGQNFSLSPSIVGFTCPTLSLMFVCVCVYIYINFFYIIYSFYSLYIHTHTHTHIYIEGWIQVTLGVTLSNVIPLNIF